MQTLDPILKAALQDGSGEPIARLQAYVRDGANFIKFRDPVPVEKYEMGRFTLSAWINASTDTPLKCYVLERGLKINGVEYLVNSPYFYRTQSTNYRALSSTAESDRLYTFVAWDTSSDYRKSTSATQTAAQVLQALLPSLTTWDAPHTAVFGGFAPWQNWQYEKSGTVTLSNFEGLLPQIWNKYTAKLFPRAGGVYLFKSAPTNADADAYTLTVTSDQVTWIEKEVSAWKWNPFWETETGATSRLSVTYPILAAYPVRNIGFLHSSVNKADVKTLLHQSSGCARHILTLPINLEVEQGDTISIDPLTYLCANITESFRMSGTTYAWQTKITGEKMYFDLQGM